MQFMPIDVLQERDVSVQEMKRNDVSGLAQRGRLATSYQEAKLITSFTEIRSFT